MRKRSPPASMRVVRGSDIAPSHAPRGQRWTVCRADGVKKEPTGQMPCTVRGVKLLYIGARGVSRRTSRKGRVVGGRAVLQGEQEEKNTTQKRARTSTRSRNPITPLVLLPTATRPTWRVSPLLQSSRRRVELECHLASSVHHHSKRSHWARPLPVTASVLWCLGAECVRSRLLLLRGTPGAAVGQKHTGLLQGWPGEARGELWQSTLQR